MLFGRRLQAPCVVRAEAHFFRSERPSPMAEIPSPTDLDLDRITGEEERCLAKVSDHLESRVREQPRGVYLSSARSRADG